MNQKASFYDCQSEYRPLILEGVLGKYGSVVRTTGGFCGEIYVFDQGTQTYPRFVVAKTPNGRPNPTEAARRFIKEIELQAKMYSHFFVHSAFDVAWVLDAPVALYRMWDGDLSRLIADDAFSPEARLSFLAYLCSGLGHCHRRGMICHQDLKPQNILTRDLRRQFSGLPTEDVFICPKLADFGLANLALREGRFNGAKPYMAPEQWTKSELSHATDVFSFGVIAFELMTFGHHPVGGITADWWPSPRVGNSKSWHSDRKWKQWVKNGLLVEQIDFICPSVKDAVQACLQRKPKDRPNLDEIQRALLNALGGISQGTKDQAAFRIQHAEAESENPDSASWPYLEDRLAHFKKKWDDCR